MKRPPRLLLALLPLALFGGGGWYLEVQRNRQRSVLSGVFESQPTQVASRVGGRVVRLCAREGDAVRAGAPLVAFEADAAQAESDARGALAAQAQGRLQEVARGPRVEEIARQRAVVDEAQALLDRLRRGPLPEELAQARARLEQADALYRRALAGPRPQELAQARAAVANARARLEQAERGPTPEEKAQALARLDVARAAEAWAGDEDARFAALLADGAVSRQQREQAEAALRQARARRVEMEQAEERARKGTPDEEREQARQALRQAQAARDLVAAGARREEIEAARAEREQARQALALLRRGARVEEIQAAVARLAQARAGMDALRAGSRPEEIAQARAAARAADTQARGAARTLAERLARAPQDGVVERLLVAVGDLVGPGAPIARLANPDDLWLRVYVPEGRLARVPDGAEAHLAIDGIAEPVVAVVESVATQGEFTPANLQTPDERGKQVFAVRLRLRRPDHRVRAGMYATVRRLGDWEPGT